MMRQESFRLRPMLEALEDRAVPATVSFQQGFDSYTGTQDTELRKGSPNTNYGTAATVEIDDLGLSGEKHVLLRFDNIFGSGTGQVPAGAIITKATLTLQVNDSGNNPTMHLMLVNWAQGTATWNSMDTSGGGIQADGVEATSSLRSISAGSAGSKEIDVTDDVKSWHDGTYSNYGWAFLPTGTNGVELRTSEYTSNTAQRPKLTIEYSLPGPAASNPDTYEALINTTLNVSAPGVLANDTGGNLTALLVQNVTKGTLTFNANGSFTYTPNTNFSGTDSFTYKATNSLGDSVETLVTINVVGQASFRNGVGGYTGTQDTEISGDNPNTNYGTAGTVEIDRDGPGRDQQVLLRFDNIFGTGAGQVPLGATITSATLTLQVNDSGDSPTMHRMLVDWSQDTATFNTFNLDGNAGIQAGSEATDTIRSLPASTTGSKSLDVTDDVQKWADGLANYGWAFLPTGSGGVELRTSEYGTLLQRPLLTITYTLNPPIAQADSYLGYQGVPLSIPAAQGVLANDSVNSKSAVLTQNVANGTLTFNADGSFTYTPNAGFFGTDTFKYKAVNGDLESEEAEVTIQVNKDVTSSFQVARSGLVRNRTTGLFNGSLTLTNLGDTVAAGTTLRVVVSNLPSGASLTNGGTLPDGRFFIDLVITADMLNKKSQSLPVVFSNPSLATLTYDVKIYSLESPFSPS
jgi:hypothetical protein